MKGHVDGVVEQADAACQILGGLAYEDHEFTPDMESYRDDPPAAG